VPGKSKSPGSPGPTALQSLPKGAV